MTFIQEFALLFAIAIPFLALVGLNVFLFCSGERGTLFVPSERALSTETTPPEAAAVVADYRISSLPAANDAIEREAA